MTDLEKKQFMRTFIESIELYPEKKDKGRIISKIELRFPVYHDGQEGNEIRMTDKNTVETVCALSKLSEAKHHVSVQVDMDELDLTAAESKATYEEIQAWVQERYGFHVTHLNIANTKRKCGSIERQNYNLPKSENSSSSETPNRLFLKTAWT
jgi:ribosomal protein L23